MARLLVFLKARSLRSLTFPSFNCFFDELYNFANVANPQVEALASHGVNGVGCVAHKYDGAVLVSVVVGEAAPAPSEARLCAFYIKPSGVRLDVARILVIQKARSLRSLTSSPRECNP